jgi:hypothetical protein
MLQVSSFEAIAIEQHAGTSCGNKAGEPSGYQMEISKGACPLHLPFDGKSAPQADGPKALTLPGQVSADAR